MSIFSPRFQDALSRFDEINRQDPNHEMDKGKPYPKELLYAERMTVCLNRFSSDASEALQLAARCQHIARWKIPREDYLMDRKGYHLWRTTLNRFHAKTASDILHELKYSEAIIRRVEGFLLKKHLKNDPEMQVLEDVICLVFLESYFLDFSKKHDKEKLITVIQKTWKKMTPRAQKTALVLKVTPEVSDLIQAALA